MDAERIAELRRDLDDDVILNREDIRELMDAAELCLVIAKAVGDLLDDVRYVDRGTNGFDSDHESLPILRAAIDAATKGGE